jgi:hypothetical protein
VGTRHLYWILNGPSFAVWEVNISEDARHWIGLLQDNPSTVVTVVGAGGCVVPSCKCYTLDQTGMSACEAGSSTIFSEIVEFCSCWGLNTYHSDQKLDILTKKTSLPVKIVQIFRVSAGFSIQTIIKEIRPFR